MGLKILVSPNIVTIHVTTLNLMFIIFCKNKTYCLNNSNAFLSS